MKKKCKRENLTAFHEDIQTMRNGMKLPEPNKGHLRKCYI